ncbi:hypothetical protein K8353_49700, partial [Burkholderia contaminans]|nr:hypothetical protein [Burkholderia contaminans]
DADVSTQIDQDKSQSEIPNSPVKSQAPLEDADLNVDSHINQKKQQEKKADSSPMKIQDELDEVNYYAGRRQCTSVLLDFGI